MFNFTVIFLNKQFHINIEYMNEKRCFQNNYDLSLIKRMFHN